MNENHRRKKRKSAPLFFMLLLTLSLTVTGCGTDSDKAEEGTYHVAVSGSDDNDGSTPKNAFASIQHAIDNLKGKGGGTILVHEGVYNERLFIGAEHSGTEDSPLVIKTYPDDKNKVSLDGSPLEGEAPYSVNPEEYNFEEEVGQLEMISIECADYVHIEGLEICNNNTPAGGWEAPMGILIVANEDKGCTGVEITNNKIHNIDGETWGFRSFIEEDEEYVADFNGHGIAAYGEGPGEETAIDGLKITGNEVYENKTGQSESVVVNGNVKNFEIKQNFVHDNNNIGIDVIGGEETSGEMDFDCARNGIVEGNVVINNSAATNQTYDMGGGCDGIYIDGGRDTVVQNNYIIGSDYCFEIGTENEPPFPLASGNESRNNILLDGDISGMIIGGSEGAKGNTVMNNTVYSLSPYEVDRNRSGDSPNDIRDNIFVTGSKDFNWVLSPDKKSATDGFVFDTNVYFGGKTPDAKKHLNAIIIDESPFVEIDKGEFERGDYFDRGKYQNTGCDTREMKAAMEKDDFLLHGAPLFDFAKANYVARTAMKPEAEKVRASLEKVKGTPDKPISIDDIQELTGDLYLTDYLVKRSGAPEGTVIGMKHSGETYEGGEDGEALNAVEGGKGKYFGMIQIGREEDGRIMPGEINETKILTYIRVYFKVPYTYTVNDIDYTSWIVGQINNVCVDFPILNGDSITDDDSPHPIVN